MTPSHQVPDKPQDAITYWLEEQSESSFTLCYREIKIFDGLHQNIKMVSELLNKCSVPSENLSVVPNLLYEYGKKKVTVPMILINLQPCGETGQGSHGTGGFISA